MNVKKATCIILLAIYGQNICALSPQEKEDINFIEEKIISICGAIDFSGNASELHISPNLEATTKTLLAKVAEINANIDVSYSKENYKGFLRNQLKDVYSTSTECRTGLTSKFIETFFNTSKNSKAESHVYEKSQIINVNDGTVGTIIQNNENN